MRSILLQHLDAQYTIPRGLGDASPIQRWLDTIAGGILTSAWEDHHARQGEYDQMIYFIEHMEVNLALDISGGNERIVAATWARALDEGIERIVRSGNSGIVVFQNRGEFVASFIGDLLRGKAWEQWYYREFEHLRSYSPGRAIVEVLSSDADAGRDALIVVTLDGDLDVLLAVLTDSEIETIVTRCLLPSAPRVVLPGTIAPWVQAIKSLVSEAGFVLSGVHSRDVARVYLTLLRERPELGPDVHLARFIQDLLHLRQVVVNLQDHRHFLALVESDDLMGTLVQLGRGKAQQVLRTLLQTIHGSETAELLRTLRVDTPQPIEERVFTHYGGIFLLIPSLLEMDLHDFFQQSPYPAPEYLSKGAFLLFLVALQCLGGQYVEQTLHDKGLATFAGLAASPTPSQLEAYASTLTPELHQAFSVLFQEHYTGVTRRLRGLVPAQENLLDPVVHADWFSLCAKDVQLLSNKEWDAAFTRVSSTVLSWFSWKLGAFAGSSPSFLYRNFLQSHAEIEISAERIFVHFLTCPLQVVLRLAGFDHTTWEVPWLANRQLAFRFNED